VDTPRFSPSERRSSAALRNDNVEVWAATCNPGSWVRALRISSAMPSQNQSWFFSSLRSVNGSTAIEA
jgi:hypothetical protein